MRCRKRAFSLSPANAEQTKEETLYAIAIQDALHYDIPGEALTDAKAKYNKPEELSAVVNGALKMDD